MPLALINGSEICFEQTGVGPPCLIMHGGLGMDLTYLHPALDPLGDTLQLTYYDHRGNGRSGRPPVETLVFYRFSADADALCERLGLDRVIVLGHSYGSFIALDFALRYPERVSRLILSNAAPAFDYGPEVLAIAQRKGATRQMLEALAVGAVADDERMAELFRVIAPLYFHSWNEQTALRLFQDTHWSAAAGARGEELLQTYDLSGRLGEIEAPTLILAGRDDFITPVSQAERLRARIRDSRLVIFERSGHFPFVEEPDTYFAAIRDWLGR
ncbi:MAG: alpha/beta fold hydrolase [Dehalococcoidia bacterium]